MSQEWNNEGGQQPEGQQSSSFRQQPLSPYKQPTPPPAPPPSTPRRSNTWIFVVIIAALLGACIYLMMNRNKIMQEKQKAIVERDTIMTSRDAINSEYEAAVARLDQLNTSNTQLSNEIKDKDGELQKIRTQLAGIMSKDKKSEGDLAKARSLINQLNNKVSSYETRITKLEGENKQLHNENENLSQQRDSTVTENKGLSQKVKLGAVLHASNIRMEALHLKHHGTKEKETGKAKRTDRLRITLDIDDNRIAESGTKDLYLRILGPDGNLLSNASYGSGSTTAADNAPLNYTLVKQIDLVQNQPVKDVSIDWNQDDDFQKGTYNIEIYNEGYKVGSGSVTLK